MAGFEKTGPTSALDLELLATGKVRDMYALGPNLVFVTRDTISAFDVPMAETIPNKGRILNAMTAYWFDELIDVVPNHRIEVGAVDLPESLDQPYYQGRTEVAKKADMLPIECIVRGRLTGSALKPYVTSGLIHGMPAPVGLEASSEFPEPMFTPSTKAAQGKHDENISFKQAVNLVGQETAEKARDISLEAFRRLSERAKKVGIVAADTKFELGYIDGVLTLCDEVGTPDSSRFWPADKIVIGQTPPSFDKQPLRDYVEGLGWNKKAPPPPLPTDVVEATSVRYQMAYERITGRKLADWPGIHEVVGMYGLLNILG